MISYWNIKACKQKNIWPRVINAKLSSLIHKNHSISVYFIIYTVCGRMEYTLIQKSHSNQQ
jgi:hypothetical protein